MTEGKPVEVKDKKLVCSHCGGDSFAERHAKLNTTLMTLFDMDWLNKTADVFVCANCGHLEWFLNPEVASDDDSTECVSCGAKIPKGHERCSRCK
ncbi:MAG: hypothetical protein Q8O92_00700 [Candidatus Latescibacter sp.]|nr:hypothetical protein [Candidatus Latescibacter sp.]